MVWVCFIYFPAGCKPSVLLNKTIEADANQIGFAREYGLPGDENLG